MMGKNYHIITFGCQMNKNDSERIETILENLGMSPAHGPGDADLIILNTCSVRQSAEDRVYGLSHNLSKLKEKNPDLIVAVTGCMAGRDRGGKIEERLKDVDLFFPISDIVKLPDELIKLNPKLRPLNLNDDYLSLTPKYGSDFQAFVTIQTGCNHFCTYCVVPHARGIEGNRPLKQILDEVNNLAGSGCLEVTLLGQIVNQYIAPDPKYFSKRNPYKKNDFAKLLWEINQMDEIQRIHWTAPHPIYMDAEVIDALTLPSQINFLHLPVQSGNSEILKKMNRLHDREYYIEIIEKIKSKRPGIAIGTDIIVGFCGETEDQFADTISLYEICDFDISYNAKYSGRDGTVADKAFQDDVKNQEKKRRWHELQSLMEGIVLKKNQKYLNNTVSVLVEECREGLCFGRSSEMKLVQFPGSDLVGTIQDIMITRAKEWILEGEIRKG